MPFFSIRNRIFKEHFTREAPFFFLFRLRLSYPELMLKSGHNSKNNNRHINNEKNKKKHENNDETDVEGPQLCTYTYLLAQNNSKIIIKKNIVCFSSICIILKFKWYTFNVFCKSAVYAMFVHTSVFGVSLVNVLFFHFVHRRTNWNCVLLCNGHRQQQFGAKLCYI